MMYVSLILKLFILLAWNCCFIIGIVMQIKNEIRTFFKLVVSRNARAWRLKRPQGINKLL